MRQISVLASDKLIYSENRGLSARLPLLVDYLKTGQKVFDRASTVQTTFTVASVARSIRSYCVGSSPSSHRPEDDKGSASNIKVNYDSRFGTIKRNLSVRLGLPNIRNSNNRNGIPTIIASSGKLPRTPVNRPGVFEDTFTPPRKGPGLPIPKKADSSVTVQEHSY